MKEVGKNKGLFRVESASNNILSVLSRESDAVLQLQVGLEQELFVVCVRRNAPPEHVKVLEKKTTVLGVRRVHGCQGHAVSIRNAQ